MKSTLTSCLMMTSLLLISSATFASPKPMLAGQECKLASHSPSTGIDAYDKIDKIIFTPPANSAPHMTGKVKFPIVTKAKPAILMIHSESLGDGLFLQVMGSVKVEQIMLPNGDIKDIQFTSTFSGDVSSKVDGEESVYKLSATHIQAMTPDEYADKGLTMELKNTKTGKVDQFIFECPQN